MKIHLTLFCLISGGALAGASTTTAEFVQDKPDRLYVASDTLFTDSYRDNVRIDNGGGVAEGQHLASRRLPVAGWRRRERLGPGRTAVGRLG